jgi:hypothetical protein
VHGDGLGLRLDLLQVLLHELLHLGQRQRRRAALTKKEVDGGPI